MNQFNSRLKCFSQQLIRFNPWLKRLPKKLIRIISWLKAVNVRFESTHVSNLSLTQVSSLHQLQFCVPGCPVAQNKLIRRHFTWVRPFQCIRCSPGASPESLQEANSMFSLKSLPTRQFFSNSSALHHLERINFLHIITIRCGVELWDKSQDIIAIFRIV